jgi:hypothetical protein
MVALGLCFLGRLRTACPLEIKPGSGLSTSTPLAEAPSHCFVAIERAAV